MAGLRDVVLLVPPVLLSQWSITSPSPVTVGACRIMDSTDATYGTIGWLPPTDGTPWAYLDVTGTKERTPEPGRVRVESDLSIFLALDNADTPAAYPDFHDRALAFLDSLRTVVAANRRLQPGSNSLYPTAGDVRWELVGSRQQNAKAALGGQWRGIECATLLTVTVNVNYQG